MIVYIVTYHDQWEQQTDIRGVFDSEEKAWIRIHEEWNPQHMIRYKDFLHDYEITEWELQ